MKNRIIKIEKLSDDVFGGVHPNGINKGFISEGEEFARPKVGESYCVGGLHTSTVTEIIDENTFKTRNSTYKIKVIN